MTSKRRASTGLTSPDSDSLSPSSGPPHKAHRPSTSPPPTNPSSQSDSQSSPLIHQCTLPPTCQPPINKPTALPDASALERHYATYHTHVCEEGPCRAVFPEARFLELHQTECHDPLAAVRKERGDKIFACFLPTCPKHFSTPKTRRMHLLQAHSYPKQYFYNITNYGIGGLLRKYGEGASLIRPDWKPRDDKQAGDDSMGVDGDSEDGKDEDLKPTPASPSSKAKPARDAPPHLQPTARQGDAGTDDVDALASNLESMQLIPPSVHFGRGASHGGFKAPSGRGRGRGGRAGRGHRARASQDRTGAAEDDEGEDEKAKERERKEVADKEREKEVIAFVPKQVRAARKSGEMKL